MSGLETPGPYRVRTVMQGPPDDPEEVDYLTHVADSGIEVAAFLTDATDGDRALIEAAPRLLTAAMLAYAKLERISVMLGTSAIPEQTKLGEALDRAGWPSQKRQAWVSAYNRARHEAQVDDRRA